MGILANVLEFKRQEEAKARADIEAIAPAIQSFIQNRRQSALDQFTMDRQNTLLDIEKQKASNASVLQQFEIGQKKAKIAAEDAKLSLLDGFIKGEIDEPTVLKNMTRFGVTPDDFDMAASARDRLMSGGGDAVPEGYEATGMIRDKMGNLVPSDIKKVAQPSEIDALNAEKVKTDISKTKQDMAINAQNQTFRFKKPIAEQKFEIEMQDRAKEQDAKRASAIDAAETAIQSIDHLIENKNFFGPIEGRMPAGLNNQKREWAKNYDFLEAKNMLNVISEMKNQSRTGATGFGQLNKEELRVLQNASMKLDKQLDEKTAEKYLKEMKVAFQKIVDREKNGYEGEQKKDDTSVPSVGGMFNGEKVKSVKRIK